TDRAGVYLRDLALRRLASSGLGGCPGPRRYRVALLACGEIRDAAAGTDARARLITEPSLSLVTRPVFSASRQRSRVVREQRVDAEGVEEVRHLVANGRERRLFVGAERP